MFCISYAKVLAGSSTRPAQTEGKVAIIFATGGLGDKSFNDSAMRGMNLAKEKYGIEFDFAEPVAIAEYQTYLTQFANTLSMI